MIDDSSLLRRFFEQRSEDAFTELVQRHLNLVYFAALRQTYGNTHRAEDAAQATFILLAQKAGSLRFHPNLAGWLHTAACHQAQGLTRTEQRRHQREQAAQTMHEITGSDANDEAWTHVRPIVDDALLDLPPDDREAILLRFFENRPFSDIGESLQLSENAARMRVTRALEQLAASLARRGVKSTASALATVLTIPAAMAAPAGFATQFATAAVSTATVAGTTATIFTVINLMTSAKLIATATCLVVLVVFGAAVIQHKRLQFERTESAVLRQQLAEFKLQLTGLQTRLAAEKKRADDADADNGLLLALTTSALNDQNKSAAPQAPITRDTVTRRYKNAQTLAKNGKSEEALKEFLWCYDTGMRQVSSFAGVRGSYLLDALVKLGKNYPPALAAVLERRDVAEQRLRASATDSDAVSDYASFNHALKEDAKNLILFTSLPADDERRQTLGFFIGEQLVEAQRYTELVQAKPFSRMQGMLVMQTGFIGTAKMSPDKVKARTNDIANSTAGDIEALAGAGDIAHASDLVSKLIAFDNSDETLATLQQHLARAGHPELLKAP